MKFFKSKAQKQAEAEEARQTVIDSFRQQIESAEKCADPAEKFLKLEECRESINEFIDVSTQQIKAIARNKSYVPYLGVAGGTAAGVGILVMGLHFPPALILLAYPGIFGGVLAGNKAMARAEARMTKDIEPLFAELRQQRNQAQDLADLVLKNDLKALAVSPRFEEIVQKAPRVRDHFTRAFAKRMEEDQLRGPPPPKLPPTGNGGLRL